MTGCVWHDGDLRAAHREANGFSPCFPFPRASPQAEGGWDSMEPRGGECFKATHIGTPDDALPQQPVFNLVYTCFASEFTLRQVIPGFSIFLGPP